jgi:hypothetical protein
MQVLTGQCYPKPPNPKVFCANRYTEIPKGTGKQVKSADAKYFGGAKKGTNYSLRIFLVLSLSLSLSSCSQPAAGEELAKSACQAWQTAWSNALGENIGDARSQFSEFSAAYDIAKAATELNEEWKPISQAISRYAIYTASSFDDSFFPDSAEQVLGMDVCEQFDIDVMG